LDLSDTSSQLVEAVGPGNSLCTNYYIYIYIYRNLIVTINSIIQYCVH